MKNTKTRAAASLPRIVSQRPNTCEWTEDENGPHGTQCDKAFEFTYDGVTANGFRYCPFCGGEIVVKLANEQAER